MTSLDASAPNGPHAEGEALIRPYRADDSASLRDCIAELQDAERAIDGRLRPGRAIASDYLDTMLEECHRYAGRVFVLEVAGAIAGFTTVFARVPFERLDEPPGDYAVVAELLVRRAYRRRGYARALLARGEQYAASQGATDLRIGVLADNTPRVRSTSTSASRLTSRPFRNPRQADSHRPAPDARSGGASGFPQYPNRRQDVSICLRHSVAGGAP